MSFNPEEFFRGFCDYLSTERRDTVSYAVNVMSPEGWVQVEAIAWLHSHRQEVGLQGGTTTRPMWNIVGEKCKTDVWLQSVDIDSPPCGIAIELKCVFNNKNFWNQVRQLRRDLSGVKRLPREFSDANSRRYGLAVLTYAQYLPEFASGYQSLCNKKQRVRSDEFVDLFVQECRSTSNWYAPHAPIEVVGAPQMIAELRGQPWIDSEVDGTAVYMALCRPAI